ncbi:PREDICTED: non-specific lipid-transfer protein 1-like [Nicotiana attenuata]|uniref:Non-specific lipid-transfer protein n=1 Tax=Nicotiana attenuata TaxID=49451 RepID=A0A314KTV6_NICAT|nr:PREDICTED: non-specific lipid-transfer protein 1-like [Nicotiana attenuata]OIT32778.1 non-specific lipid-transfer protein 1 [Nicotiana attenuata]
MIGKIACLVLFCMAVAMPRHAEALTCYQVTYNLMGCLSYLTNTGDLGSCCAGVKALHSAANTQLHRQTACTCIQFAGRAIPGIDWDKASDLPGICEVEVHAEINPSTDCSMIE